LPEIEMKVTIRVEIATDWNETENFEIGEIERQYCELDRSKIGLSLAEGKDEGRLGELSRGLRELPRYVSSIDEFPKTSTQRIRKNELSRELAGVSGSGAHGLRAREAACGRAGARHG
jgi:hypothetical protein